MGGLPASHFRRCARQAKPRPMGQPHRDNRMIAIACILAGVGIASTQDAITKIMAAGYPAHETLLLRCIGSLPVLIPLLLRSGGFHLMWTPLLGRVAVRGLILGCAYLCFVLAIAAMPIANAVAIYFTMPFFVAGLAGPMLGERVRLHRWLAIVAGFIGVMIMVRPGVAAFEPAAIFALLSALGYAIGQMIGRPLSQQVQPVVIAVWQNLIYFAISAGLGLIFGVFDFGPFQHPSLVFLARPFVMPEMMDAAILLGNGLLAAFGMLFFVNAYKHAESNFVAPFEYSAMVWAVLYGLVVFHDFPGIYTWVGAAVVVSAGILMIWRDRQLDRAS